MKVAHAHHPAAWFGATWEQTALGDALSALASRLTGQPSGSPLPNPPPELGLRRPIEVEQWIEGALGRAGLGLAPIDARAVDLEGVLGGAREAALFHLPPSGAGGGRFVLVVAVNPRANLAHVLCPHGAILAVPLDELEAELFAWPSGGTGGTNVDPLARLDLPAASLRSARRVFGRFSPPAAGARPAAPGWMVFAAARDFPARLRAARVPGLAALAVGATALQLFLHLLAFFMIGKGALNGRLDASWLSGFALVMVSVLIARAVAERASARLTVACGGLLRERLFEGILKHPVDRLRGTGIGQALGRLLEVDAIEALSRGSLFLAGFALLELVIASGILALGIGGWWSVGLLGGWLSLSGLLIRRYAGCLRRLADARLALAHDLVEKMVSHRTRAVQGRQSASGEPDGLDAEERTACAAYEEAGIAHDRTLALAQTLIPRGFLVLGLLSFTPAFAAGGGGPGALAAGVGGLLLAVLALRRITQNLALLGAAGVAWSRSRDLFAQAALPDNGAEDLLATAPDENAPGNRGLLIARDVSFRYPGRSEPALHGCDLFLKRGEQMVIRGASGSGKSTLGAILAGLRQPDSGVLLLGGFDHHSLGERRWRQRVGSVPQFHENHIFSASLMFNLLLGRRWPPTADDMARAEEMCGALGLGPLIERMPSGLGQMVGDTGWQLSHGERSRVFIARSLLQELDARVLDESLAALDPETLDQVLQVIRERAPTLAIIAHT